MGSGKNHSLSYMRRFGLEYCSGREMETGTSPALKKGCFRKYLDSKQSGNNSQYGAGHQGLFPLFLFLICLAGCNSSMASQQQTEEIEKQEIALPDTVEAQPPAIAALDTLQYLELFNALTQKDDTTLWLSPQGLPNPGAILPFYRIIAYYGNLYSKGMGVLGALPKEEMLSKLQEETIKWQQADSLIPAKPALHYIAVTAQREPGRDGKYRLRMPGKEIEKVLDMAKSIDALVFLDIQVGHSRLQDEIPLLKDFLALPNVHLGIDPEYSMKDGSVPGRRVGTMDAEDINYASEWLAQLVREYHLPPKILVVHRFKKTMVTGYKDIMIRPEVQLVMNMDGFGSRGKKLTTYRYCITAEPVQFAGFKLFYKNDTIDPAKPIVMQPDEVLALYPVPIYIQYQ